MAEHKLEPSPSGAKSVLSSPHCPGMGLLSAAFVLLCTACCRVAEGGTAPMAPRLCSLGEGIKSRQGGFTAREAGGWGKACPSLFWVSLHAPHLQGRAPRRSLINTCTGVWALAQTSRGCMGAGRTLGAAPQPDPRSHIPPEHNNRHRRKGWQPERWPALVPCFSSVRTRKGKGNVHSAPCLG